MPKCCKSRCNKSARIDFNFVSNSRSMYKYWLDVSRFKIAEWWSSTSSLFEGLGVSYESEADKPLGNCWLGGSRRSVQVEVTSVFSVRIPRTVRRTRRACRRSRLMRRHLLSRLVRRSSKLLLRINVLSWRLRKHLARHILVWKVLWGSLRRLVLVEIVGCWKATHRDTVGLRLQVAFGSKQTLTQSVNIRGLSFSLGCVSAGLLHRRSIIRIQVRHVHEFPREKCNKGKQRGARAGWVTTRANGQYKQNDITKRSTTTPSLQLIDCGEVFGWTNTSSWLLLQRPIEKHD